MLRPTARACRLWMTFAAVALPLGCRDTPPAGVEVHAVDLLPSDAQIAIGGNVEQVVDSPLGGILRAAVAAEPDLGKLVDAARECELAPDTRVTFAASLDSEEDFVLVAEAPRIGEWTRVQCVERAAQRENTEVRLIYRDRGPIRTVPQRGGGSVMILNKNAVAVVTSPFEAEVLERAQRAQARPPTELGKVIAGVDDDAHMWIAATIDAATAARLDEDVDGATALRAVAVSVVFTGQGAEAAAGSHFRLGFENAASAAAFAEELDSIRPGLAVALGETDLGERIAEAMSIEADGSFVDVRVRISGADMTALLAAALE